jgi:predicted nucleotidyltransferase
MEALSEPQLMEILESLRRSLSLALGDQLERVLLFGSWARDEACPESDIDVLVVVRGSFDYGDLIRRTSRAVSALSLEHNVVISRAFVSVERFEQEQSPFLMNVRREGIVL